MGFTDAGQQISAVTIGTIGDLIGVDDLRFGMVPEPSTAVLALIAVAGIVAVGRRRKR